MTTDGRVLRGERTRERLIDALLELLHAGNDRPKAKEIAEQAGVSLRSVFQHFDDLDALYAAVVARQAEVITPLVRGLSHDGDLPTRIASLVANRATLYETVGPVRRGLDDAARASVAVTRGLAELSGALRSQLSRHFRAELPPPGRDRKELLAAVEAVTSFDTWQHLRTTQGCSAAAASAAVRRTLTALLGAA